jgi:hypothetical protein
MLLMLIVGLVVLCFGLVVFRGAPYVPTHPKLVEAALRMAPPKGTLVDLGSGDGTMLVAAARRGRASIGIELNPLLVALTWYRLRRYRELATVRLGDFWRIRLPDDTAVIFVFLAGPFMDKLSRYVQREADRLGREISLISYGFELPGLLAARKEGAMTLYKIAPTSLQSTDTLIP